MSPRCRHALCALLTAVVTVDLRAWATQGHRLVNGAALASLPADFPRFVHTAENRERILFLSAEPDRWSSAVDLPLQHQNRLEHFIDLEHLVAAGLDPATVSPLRYEFMLAFARGRTAHADRFPDIDPAQDAARTKRWPGLLPWAIAESYGKLRAAFAALQAYEEFGSRAEIANAEANIVHAMGLLGHYVADASQPLHTTQHFNGWVGRNPHGYTTSDQLHAWIDHGVIERADIQGAEVQAGIDSPRVLGPAPARDGRDLIFVAAIQFVVGQNAKVERLYQLEKDGSFGGPGRAIPGDGRTFIVEQLRVGAEMVAALWCTAWRTATPDLVLRRQLATRGAARAEANR